MYGVRHPLVTDFPDHTSMISQMKNDDPQFARLMSEYDQTDKRIYGLERASLPAADDYVEGLKKRRVLLKDQIYSILTQQR
jgi:hypothetical protein